MSEKKILYARLKKIRKNIPNINYGGCGYMALYLYDYFTRKNIHCEIIQFKSKKLFRLSHFMIKTKLFYYVDSNGLWNRFYVWFLKLFCKEIVFTEKQLKARLKNPNYWNKKFTRARNLNIFLYLNYYLK